jgi:hypothetical protein
MAEGFTAHSRWNEKHKLGMMSRIEKNSLHQMIHYNPTGPTINELQEIVLRDKTSQEMMEATNLWIDIDRNLVLNKIVKKTDSLQEIKKVTKILLGKDISILKIENLDSENFKKINGLIIEEQIAIEEAVLAQELALLEEIRLAEEAALTELQKLINEELNP